MSLYIIRAFVEMRKTLSDTEHVVRRLAEIDRSLLEHDAALYDLYEKLLPLLSPPEDPGKSRIGFGSHDS